MDDLLRVGVITSPHGIRGEVNLFPTTDEPEQFKHWKTLVLVQKREQKELKLQSAKFFKQMVIVKLEGIDDRNQAELLRQAELYIHRSQARPCEENENYITDLIGLKVVDEEKTVIGTCSDVLQTGANDVYEVTCPDGKQVLFPAIPQCILKVDLEAGEILVHVMDGLMDL
ncbi:MAG: 16S rRNA processing protein RimM [Lachnospiraceae bacterium]|nr:16S rRNA processing protein RimM [Lachnospiraceae bacterium]